MNAILPIFKKSVGAQVIDVTPKMAAQILDLHNYSNRDIKTHVVEKYARMMNMGDWKFTPETICVSVTGRLLQGQHRMLAVMKSGVTCRFLFATGFPDDVFDVLDRGTLRTTSDALGIQKKLAEVSKLLAFITIGGRIVSDADTRRASDVLNPVHTQLMNHCGKNVKMFSSAPMRLAAVARIMGGSDPNYVLDLYKSLVLGNTADMPPIGHAVIKAFLSGALEASTYNGGGGGKQMNTLSIAWMIYDPAECDRQRLSYVRNDASIAQLIKATGYEA